MSEATVQPLVFDLDLSSHSGQMLSTMLSNASDLDANDTYRPLMATPLSGNWSTTQSPSLELTEDEKCKAFVFVLYVPIFGLMCIFGLVGNTLSIMVLQWEKQNKVATFLLQLLAFADNCFLVATGLSQIYAALTLYTGSTSDVGPFLQVLVWPLVHITQMETVWVTVLIAANRYIAICKPFRAPLLITMRKTRLQVLLVTISVLIYNIPRFLEFRIYHHVDSITNTTSTTAMMSELKKDRLYNILYENVLYCLFIFLGPLVILALLNMWLTRELWQARKRRVQRHIVIAGEEEEDQNLTLVMVIIILTFVTCQTPAFINQLLSVLHPDGYQCGDPYYYYYHVSNLLVSANSSVNFVIYCAFRQQFRQRLRAFCHKKHFRHLEAYYGKPPVTANCDVV